MALSLGQMKKNLGTLQAQINQLKIDRDQLKYNAENSIVLRDQAQVIFAVAEAVIQGKALEFQLALINGVMWQGFNNAQVQFAIDRINAMIGSSVININNPSVLSGSGNVLGGSASNIGAFQNVYNEYVMWYYHHKAAAEKFQGDLNAVLLVLSDKEKEATELAANIATIETGIANLQSQGIDPATAGEMALAQFENDVRYNKIIKAVQIGALVIAVIIAGLMAYSYFTKKKLL